MFRQDWNVYNQDQRESMTPTVHILSITNKEQFRAMYQQIDFQHDILRSMISMTFGKVLDNYVK